MNVSAVVRKKEGETCRLLGMWQCSITNGVGAHRQGQGCRGAAGMFGAALAKPPAIQPL